MVSSVSRDRSLRFPPAPQPLAGLPGYAVVLAARALRHAMDDALREVDLTTPQWGTLATIGYREGVTGAELARIHQLTPQTMHTILQNLEHAGLIVRERGADHGTLLRLRLTDEGRARLDDAMQHVQAVQDRMVSDLDETEQRTLADLLSRCTMSLLVDGIVDLSSSACADL